MDDYLHTNYKQQRKAVREIEQRITLELVAAHFMQKLKIKILSMERLSTNGVINFIYLLQSDNQKLILRVSNPHPFWRLIKTPNQVAILKLVKQKTNIPAPTVIDYEIYQQKSSLKSQYILFEFIQNDGTLCQYINSIKDDPNFLTKAKSLIKDGIQIIKELSQIKLNNQYFGGTNLEHAPVGARWDGPGIGPFTKISDLLSEGIRVSVLELNRQIVQKQADNSSEFNMKQIVEALEKVRKELTTGQIDLLKTRLGFIWKHGDLHPGNLSVKNGKINGVYDWQASRTGLLEEHGKEYNLVEWFCDLNLDKSIQEDLVNYQNQLVKEYNLPTEPNWEQYKKYFQIMFYSFWSWFYSVTWWSENTDEQLPGCARTQQNSNLIQLVSVLKKQGYL